jgi:hypothetical protein
VIRRGFWLVVGAAGGVMGYRRVSALSRRVSEALGTRSSTRASTRSNARPGKPAAAKRHWARETIRFTRDVREGMDLYSARHPREEPSSLGRESRRALRAALIEALFSRRASHAYP